MPLACPLQNIIMKSGIYKSLTRQTESFILVHHSMFVFGGLQVKDAKRLKTLEVENTKLKRLLAEAMLANDAIREFLEKKITPVERHTLLASVEEKGLSKRAACRWTGISRSASQYKLQRPDRDAQYVETMRQSTKDNPRYGYRRIGVVTGLGFGCSWRLWKQYERPRKPRKKEKTPALPQQAEYLNHIWSYDLLFDRLADGRPFKTLSILDEFT